MADLKIITHTSYTYETTDGREFEELEEATAWQKAIDTTKHIIMLNAVFKPTNEVEDAYFIYVKDNEQVEAFNAVQADLGIASYITDPGYHYYDEVSAEYINIDKKIDELCDMKDKLKHENFCML